MTTDVDELTWMAEHRPLAADPDAATTDRAYAALSRHISRASSAKRRQLRRRLAVRLGVAATAVAAATAFVVIGPTTSPHPDAAPRSSALSSPSRSGVVIPVLYRLANFVVKAPTPPGNATLIIAHTTFYGPQSNHPPITDYSLLEDNDSAYGGATLAKLRQSMAATPSSSAHDQLIAAAAASANVSPAQAAANIEHALPEQKQLSQAQRDELLWADASGIFWGGAGHPPVRAGVLKALATLPSVHTKAAVYRGEDVLLVTNSHAPLGFYGPTNVPYASATVAIDAHTGDLVYSTLPGETTQFHTRRVDAPSLTPAN
jgi:hypothetical protein